MVKNIMDKPILGIPIKSKTLKIPFIKTPRTLAIGPKISPSYWLKTIPVNLFPPVFDFTDPFYYGTGSYPPFEKGLHLKILHKARNPPLKTPYFSTASKPYSEQVGK